MSLREQGLPYRKSSIYFGDGYQIHLERRDQVKALLGRAGEKTRHETQVISHQIIRRPIAGW